MNDTLNMSFPLLGIDCVMRSSAFRLECRIMQPSYAFCFFLSPLFLKNRMKQKKQTQTLKWLIIRLLLHLRKAVPVPAGVFHARAVCQPPRRPGELLPGASRGSAELWVRGPPAIAGEGSPLLSQFCPQ